MGGSYEPKAGVGAGLSSC